MASAASWRRRCKPSSGLAIADWLPPSNAGRHSSERMRILAMSEGAKRAGMALMKDGRRPDERTLTNLLMAVSHAGLGLRAIDLLNWAVAFFGVQPNVIHVASVVDALARAGHLKEAHDFILSVSSEGSANALTQSHSHGSVRSLPIAEVSPNEVTWTALLGGARTHRNVVYGEIAFNELVRVDPNNTTGHRAAAMVLMSQIYFLAGRFEDAERVRGEMKSRGVKKVPGVTKVEIGDELHAFVCDDSMHPAMKEIRALNEKLHAQMVSVAGYQPDVSEIVFDESEQAKQQRLCEHSERLALCWVRIAAHSRQQ